jgi:hypothetical protein
MARRTRNRMELRDQFEAAERRKDEEETDEEETDEEEGGEEAEEGDDDEEAPGDEDEVEAGEGEGDEDEEGVPKKKKKAKAKVKVVKPKSRARTPKVVRMRVVWGVFNNSHQCVATYQYPKRSEADEHAARLTTDKRSTHFVQPVKEPIEEKKEKEK